MGIGSARETRRYEIQGKEQEKVETSRFSSREMNGEE